MYAQSQIVAIPAESSPAGIRYGLPGGERTEIEALCFTLETAPGGFDRQVVAQLQDGLGVNVYAVAAAAQQAGGFSVVYSFAPLVPPFGTAALGFTGGPFPRACSGDPLYVVVTVVNADAGDVIRDGRLTVTQHPIRPDTSPEG